MSNIVKKLVSGIAKIFTNCNEHSTSNFVDWYDLAHKLDPYVSNKSGETRHVVIDRLEYIAFKEAVFWWQNYYGNTSQPGVNEMNQPYFDMKPYNRLAVLETELRKKEESLEAAGLSKSEFGEDMQYVNLFVQHRECELWSNFALEELSKWRGIYESITDTTFKYEPYEERNPVMQKQAASSTKSIFESICNR